MRTTGRDPRRLLLHCSMRKRMWRAIMAGVMTLVAVRVPSVSLRLLPLAAVAAKWGPSPPSTVPGAFVLPLGLRGRRPSRECFYRPEKRGSGRRPRDRCPAASLAIRSQALSTNANACVAPRATRVHTTEPCACTRAGGARGVPTRKTAHARERAMTPVRGRRVSAVAAGRCGSCRP